MSNKFPKINWLYIAGVLAALIILYVDHAQERAFQHHPNHFLRHLFRN